MIPIALPPERMVVSAAQTARRGLVKVCKSLASIYAVRLEVGGDSRDDVVLKAFRQLSLQVHPDKGGRLEHSQQLNAAKDAWDKARHEKKGQSGRPTGSSKNQHAPEQWSSVVPKIENPLPDSGKLGFRVHSLGVLLTYNGISDLAQWKRFVLPVSLSCLRQIL